MCGACVVPGGLCDCVCVIVADSVVLKLCDLACDFVCGGVGGGGGGAGVVGWWLRCAVCVRTPTPHSTRLTSSMLLLLCNFFAF